MHLPAREDMMMMNCYSVTTWLFVIHLIMQGHFFAQIVLKYLELVVAALSRLE